MTFLLSNSRLRPRTRSKLYFLNAMTTTTTNNKNPNLIFHGRECIRGLKFGIQAELTISSGDNFPRDIICHHLSLEQKSFDSKLLDPKLFSDPLSFQTKNFWTQKFSGPIDFLYTKFFGPKFLRTQNLSELNIFFGTEMFLNKICLDQIFSRHKNFFVQKFFF